MNRVSLTRSLLIKVRRRSIRRGAWFRALRGMDRCILDLTIRCVDRVRSPVLSGALMRIIEKLSDALRSRFISRIDALGRPLAERLSRIAQSLGYDEAASWVDDLAFIRFLGVRKHHMCKIYA
jgi:hypothetical protein